MRLKVLLRAVNLLHETHGFTSLPKEVILKIFKLRKNPSTPAGFEPANFGSSGEYDNHGTTGVDVQYILNCRLPLGDYLEQGSSTRGPPAALRRVLCGPGRVFHKV